MKRKKILIGAFALLSVFTLSACDNTDELKKEIEELKAENEELKNKNEDLNSENEELKNENDELVKSNILNDSFAVKFTDVSGKSLTQIFDLDDYDNVLDALCSFTNVSHSSSQYGEYINSINGFYDSNWSPAIYENGEYAQVGVDGLTIDSGDVFEFKYEFWNINDFEYGTYDKYDVLVDKAIYNYYLNVLPKKLANVDSFTGITYWDSMAINKLLSASNGDGFLYNIPALKNDIFNASYKNSVDSQNLNELTGNNFFKYYYAARYYDKDLSNFKELYKTYLSTLSGYGSFGEYSLPFHSSVAKTMGIDNYLSASIKNTDYIASVEYGPEGLAWELTGLSSYHEIPDTTLNLLTFDTLQNAYSKDVSLSSFILPYAANNKNVRSLKNSENVDVIRFLFENYFDFEEMKFETENLADDISSNQIYAALVAYKVQRDSAKEINLFE